LLYRKQLFAQDNIILVVRPATFVGRSDELTSAPERARQPVFQNAIPG
jgi:hypothetical protein